MGLLQPKLHVTSEICKGKAFNRAFVLVPESFIGMQTILQACSSLNRSHL